MRRPTGPELRAARISAGVTVAAVAGAMHVSIPRIRALELQPALRSSTAGRYVEALRAAWSARAGAAIAAAMRATDVGVA